MTYREELEAENRRLMNELDEIVEEFEDFAKNMTTVDNVIQRSCDRVHARAEK